MDDSDTPGYGGQTRKWAWLHTEAHQAPRAKTADAEATEQGQGPLSGPRLVGCPAALPICPHTVGPLLPTAHSRCSCVPIYLPSRHNAGP